MPQRRSTCAGVRPQASAICATAGSFRCRPVPSGLYASSTISFGRARLEKPLAVGERVEQHLVDDRRLLSLFQEVVDFSDREVRDADGARVAELARPLHPRPRPGWPSGRPVNDVEVDELQAEPTEAPFELDGGITSRRKELGCDEDLLARNAAFADSYADALLVAVRLSGVYVPLSGLERPTHGVDAFLLVLNLPDAEPKHGNRIPVGKPVGVLSVASWLGHRRDPSPHQPRKPNSADRGRQIRDAIVFQRRAGVVDWWSTARKQP